jgi:pimeloyl-ACP methyl ester carboxylesterase
VLENGMPRFFRRFAEGVFDEADVTARANELADFVGEARAAYGLEAPVALGFSNGANIAAALMLLRPEVLAGAALLRAMVPLSAPPAAGLSGKTGADPLRLRRSDRAGGECRALGRDARARGRRRSITAPCRWAMACPRRT